MRSGDSENMSPDDSGEFVGYAYLKFNHSLVIRQSTKKRTRLGWGSQQPFDRIGDYHPALAGVGLVIFFNVGQLVKVIHH